jgi:hypothetical protein
MHTEKPAVTSGFSSEKTVCIEDSGTAFLGAISMADPEREKQVIRAFLDSARDEQALATMSNEELSILLIDLVWGKCALLSPEAPLLEEIEKRLQHDPHFKRTPPTQL